MPLSQVTGAQHPQIYVTNFCVQKTKFCKVIKLDVRKIFRVDYECWHAICLR